MSWLDDDAGNTWTAGTGASQDTVTYKFATGALQFADANLYNIHCPDSAAFALGANSFCIDFWVYPIVLPETELIRAFCGHGRLGSSPPNMARWEFYLKYESQSMVWSSYDTNGESENIAATTGFSAGLTVNNWQHIACCANKNGSNLDVRMFCKGTQVGNTITLVNPTITDPGGLFCVGTSWSFNNLHCKIDEFRFSIGTARWTANFTPPVARYTIDEYTKILMHYGAAPPSDSMFFLLFQ